MQAMSAGSLVAVSSLREFFRDAFHAASEHQRLDIDEQAEQYVVNLLTMFSRADALYERTPEGLRIKPLAHMLAESLEAPNAGARQRSLQRLGDVSLFVAGFFARSFARKLVDIDYHIAMGGNAYSALADTLQRSLSGRCVAAVYVQLAQKFQRLVDALNEVSEMSYRHTDADILRLYEIWMKTGSPARARAAEQARRTAREAGRSARALGIAREAPPSIPEPRAWDPMSAVLRGMQSLLGRLYDVDVRHDVADFLITDRHALRHITPENDTRALDEELLVAETADGAGVALYLDPGLLQRLESADPLGALSESNIADYCTALEGVSHFLYTAWRLDGDASVSLLELETQAEVDKYAATVFLLAHQQGGAYPVQVHPRLFDRVSFDARLEPEQYDRYRTAHRCAARYCRGLERRFVQRGEARIEALLRELRKFYRLGSTAKLRHALA